MKPQIHARAIRSIRNSLLQTPKVQVPHNAALRIPPTSTLRTLTTSTPRPHNQPQTPPAPTPHSTVDPTEVSHFNALASSWWDPHGPSRLLHLMNPLRHTFISSCLSSSPTPPPRQLRYLDIGCGGGIFAESAARLPNTHSVTAIDPTPGVLRIAEAHRRRDPVLMEKGRLVYVNCSVEELAARRAQQQQQHPQQEGCDRTAAAAPPAEGYDIITLFEVLEHVHAPGPFLAHVLPLVKPGGWLVLSTIARTWTSWLVTNVLAEDVLGVVPRGTHDWAKYVNEAELRTWFEAQEGWGQVRSLGVVYVPGLGWREVRGGERWGNYFLGVRREG